MVEVTHWPLVSVPDSHVGVAWLVVVVEDEQAHIGAFPGPMLVSVPDSHVGVAGLVATHWPSMSVPDSHVEVGSGSCAVAVVGKMMMLEKSTNDAIPSHLTRCLIVISTSFSWS